MWAATTTEATLEVLLLTGWRPKLVGAATCLVLITFGTAMAVSLGMESPLSYSVFSAASAAAAYAILGTPSLPHTTDTTHPWRLIQCGHSKPSQADPSALAVMMCAHTVFTSKLARQIRLLNSL